MKLNRKAVQIMAVVLGVVCLLNPVALGQRLPKKAVQRIAQKASARAENAARTAVLRARAAAIAGAKRAAPKEAAVYSAALVQEKIKSAVFFMYTPAVQASGFFMEEYYMGKRLVWAVIPAHALVDESPFFIAEYIKADGTVSRQALRVMAYGSAGYQNYDFSLALVPPEMQDEVFALRLAQENPNKGDLVSSFGFYSLNPNAEFAGSPKQNTGRVIESVDNSRITTSYPFGKHNPSGACGGPLLNEKGEVVGIHSGSNTSASCSFAVAAPGPVRAMLADVHGDKQLLRPVVWNGREICRLTASQRISRVEVKRDGRTIDSVLLTKREKPFDYGSLEQLVPQARRGDKIYIELKDQRFMETETLEFVVK